MKDLQISPVARFFIALLLICAMVALLPSVSLSQTLGGSGGNAADAAGAGAAGSSAAGTGTAAGAGAAGAGAAAGLSSTAILGIVAGVVAIGGIAVMAGGGGGDGGGGGGATTTSHHP